MAKGWCLTTEATNKFLKGLQSGDINPDKLAGMTSAGRRAYLAGFVGDDNAMHVNGLFESKLLLKNQKAGMINWAKKVGGLKPEAKRDLISRIEKLDKVLDPEDLDMFLHDLVATKLGVEVTEVEAKTIYELSNKVQELKTKVRDDFTFPSKTERLEYGLAVNNLRSYMASLKTGAGHISFSEDPLRVLTNIVKETPGILKSIVASLDNSFWGRQGLKTLYTNPDIWARAFVKSWKDISMELRGKDAMIVIKADIYSRPNALNGKYEAGGYGLDIFSEEEYPSSLPEKIPLLGRLFKASESAYNGAALRLRSDLADRIIKNAEENGVNTLDRKEARGLGRLVSSLTGRGNIGKAENISKELNVLFFSVKFFKSNFDTLTAHAFDTEASKYVKKVSAQNLLKIVGTIAAMMTVAKIIDPNSVDEDPRSSKFGKIKVFGHWTDVTAGLGSLVHLAAQITPTEHNGEWGFWTKNSQTGAFTKLGTEYGGQSALDVIDSFWQGKLSPLAGTLRDVWAGKTYEGKPVTLDTTIKSISTPLSIQTFKQLMKDSNSSFLLGSLIIDWLGFTVSTTSNQTDWDTNPNLKIKQFRLSVGDEKFKKANEDFNKEYADWFEKVSRTSSYKKLPDDAKKSLILKSKEKIQDKIFRKNNFKYNIAKKRQTEIDMQKTSDSLLPK